MAMVQELAIPVLVPESQILIQRNLEPEEPNCLGKILSGSVLVPVVQIQIPCLTAHTFWFLFIYLFIFVAFWIDGIRY